MCPNMSEAVTKESNLCYLISGPTTFFRCHSEK